MSVTKEQAEFAVTILRTPGVSHRDMACALYNVIWGFQTLDEVRAATFDVGFPVFYESMVEACINPEVKELWPEPTSIFADLANALRTECDGRH